VVDEILLPESIVHFGLGPAGTRSPPGSAVVPGFVPPAT
jgi:hypothetical protein